MKNLDKIEKVRGTEDELEVLARLKGSVEWAVVKRMATRYVRNLQKVSFRLVETDPHYLAVRHAELAGQALGIKSLIDVIENSAKRLEKMEGGGK